MKIQDLAILEVGHFAEPEQAHIKFDEWKKNNPDQKATSHSLYSNGAMLYLSIIHEPTNREQDV